MLMHSAKYGFLVALIICVSLRLSTCFHVPVQYQSAKREYSRTSLFRPSDRRKPAFQNAPYNVPTSSCSTRLGTYRKQGDNPTEQFLRSNPLTRVFYNLYSFFFWFPKKNMPYVYPFDWVKNSSLEFLAYYQFPQNLPPYIYLGDGYPDDFFCWGLPGATLPLGNWDPFCFHQVSPKVVKKYRESELKHGRLAMMATTGFLVQEGLGHPLHPEIGGMAITHVEQLQQLGLDESILVRSVLSPIITLLGANADDLLKDLPQIPLDYIAIILFLASLEIRALLKNWTRWGRDEYNHQFDDNFGIGNLKDSYMNGNYGFDPLRLAPSKEENPAEWLEMQNKELNHCRLAMVAFVGLLVQEYVTGIPSWIALRMWIQQILEGDSSSTFTAASSGEFASGIGASSPSMHLPESLNDPSKIFSAISDLLQNFPKSIIGGDSTPPVQ